MVKKRQISIDYEVTKFGPSGIKSVELYVTRDDGRTWLRCDGEDNINVPLPAEPRGTAAASLKRSLTVELQADGLYGFYLVVKSGAGLGKPPPQNGIDVPQIRIEVDTTAPKADLFEPRPHPTRRDCLVLSLDRRRTTSWGRRRSPCNGPSGPIANGSRSAAARWRTPASTSGRCRPTSRRTFTCGCWCRDQAGNESVAQTAQPVLVDLNEPEVKPLQITVGR